MWNKTQQPEPASGPASPSSVPARSSSSASNSQSSARIGASLQIKGQIIGTENLQIDGKVEGPISLRGHELTVGSTALLNSEIETGEVVVFGKIVGNLRARGRVDIRRDGSVVGDISAARISIEDGAHFKGRIEIDPAKSQANAAD